MADVSKISKLRKRQGAGKTAGPAKDADPAPAIRPSTRVRAADRKALMIRLDDDTHRALKRYAFENDTSIQAIAEGLLLDFLDGKGAATGETEV